MGVCVFEVVGLGVGIDVVYVGVDKFFVGI